MTKGTLKLKDICPACFSETGYSITLESRDNALVCPDNPEHRYKRSKDGFLEREQRRF